MDEQMSALIERAISELPSPLDGETYTFLRRGIYDAEDVEVYINDACDFAFLHPKPRSDYTQYVQRAKKIGQHDLVRKKRLLERRFAKVSKYFEGVDRILELGASDGSFLEILRKHFPDCSMACLELDELTKPARDQLAWLKQYESFEEIESAGETFDVVCHFHVFEHVAEPKLFIAACRNCLASEGQLIMEVPSLSDPLLELYTSSDFRDFYFQRQHPFVYSASSLQRVLERCGLCIDAVVAHQRYGLENHLNWLINGTSGGDDGLQKMFADCDEAYTACLEHSGITDTVIVIAHFDH